MTEPYPQNTAAKYTDNAEKDSSAVTALKFILEPHVDASNLQTNDTTPSHDGIITVKDDSKRPDGFICSQIKYVDAAVLQIRKFSIDRKFLDFIRTSNIAIPVILFIVSPTEVQTYWRHISKKEATDIIENAPSQLSFTITFSEKNLIKKGDTQFIEQWRKIIKQYQPSLEALDELEKLKRLQDLLIHEVEDGLQDLRGLDYTKIQEFLDELNYLLNRPFNLIKKVLFPNTWEVGFAFSEFDENLLLGGVVFPIKSGHQNLKIKRLKTGWEDKLSMLGLVALSSTPNRLAADPEKYAKDYINANLKSIFRAGAISFSENGFLLRELVFFMVDLFYKQFGLELKEIYSVAELEYALKTYFPLWVETTIETFENKGISMEMFRHFLNNGLFSRSHLHMLIFNYSLYESDITNKISEKIKSGKLPNMAIAIQDNEFKQLQTHLLSLSGSNIVLERLYPSIVSNLVLTESHLKIFYECLPSVFTDLVKTNFTYLADALNKQMIDKRLDIFIKTSSHPAWGGTVYDVYMKRLKKKKGEQMVSIHSGSPHLPGYDSKRWTADAPGNRYLFTIALSELKRQLHTLYPWIDFWE